jgi:hypothetical protein
LHALRAYEGSGSNGPLMAHVGPPVAQGQKLAVEIESANDPCID